MLAPDPVSRAATSISERSRRCSASSRRKTGGAWRPCCSPMTAVLPRAQEGLEQIPLTNKRLTRAMPPPFPAASYAPASSSLRSPRTTARPVGEAAGVSGAAAAGPNARATAGIAFTMAAAGLGLRRRVRMKAGARLSAPSWTGARRGSACARGRHESRAHSAHSVWVRVRGSARVPPPRSAAPHRSPCRTTCPDHAGGIGAKCPGPRIPTAHSARG